METHERQTLLADFRDWCTDQRYRIRTRLFAHPKIGKEAALDEDQDACMDRGECGQVVTDPAHYDLEHRR